MKQKRNPLSPRAALLIGAALVSTPAIAQEAVQQTVNPPPLVNPQVVEPPVVAPVQVAPATTPVVRMAPSTPIVQAVPPSETVPQSSAAADNAPRTERALTPSRAKATKPMPPAPAALQARPAETPSETVPSAAPARDVTILSSSEGGVAAPSASLPGAVKTTQTVSNDRSHSAYLPWVIGALVVVLAGIAAMILMRRRGHLGVVDSAREADQPMAAHPLPERPVVGRLQTVRPIVPAAVPTRVPTPKPVLAASPATAPHVEASLAEPAASDLAGVLETSAPVRNRPWIELGLHPVRAGTNDDEVLVDIALTVGNAGDTAARNVRISTFLLADVNEREMDRLLTQSGSAGNVPSLTIQARDGTRVDAHLAVPKGELGRVFNPVVVAEARYTLPDGGEGRTTAAFRIGRPAPAVQGLGPIGATRPHMVEDVEAELVGRPDRR